MTAAALPAFSSALLDEVIALVTEAGTWLAAEFARPDGPRSSNSDTSPIDTEIELFLRSRLTALLPARFVGEEAGVLAAEANGYCWVVDPHDGTRAFLEGRRGSAISVALLREGTPVVGVVYAPTSPDRGPDMIAWAEGGSITRNRVAVTTDLSQRNLAAGDVVFLNHGAGQRPIWHSVACAPARFMPLPSIAYRLARVAVGDGIATVTLRPVNAHDIAAGHALLTAAGGVLVAEDGVPVTYGQDGDSRPFACFGGAPAAVGTLRTRIWRGSTEPRHQPKTLLTWPRAAEGRRLDRALGCMLGLVIGDSLDPGNAAAALRCQPNGAAEPALALARSLLRTGRYDPADAAASYGKWITTGPLSCGHSAGPAFRAAAASLVDKAQAARDRADPTSQSSEALTRMAPLGLWARGPDEAAAAASEDVALSHPHPVCRYACAALAAAISAAIEGADRDGMMVVASRVADAGGAEAAPVSAALRLAAAKVPPVDFAREAGSVLACLQNAFYHLAAGASAAAALIETINRSDDSDAAVIAGALLGAADGRASLPAHWVTQALTCRPDPAMHPARPRPEEYWADDLLDLSEALLYPPSHHAGT